MSRSRVCSGGLLVCVFTATVAAFVLPRQLLSQDTTKWVSGQVVYSTSRAPVVGRAIRVSYLADPTDLAARPAYSPTRETAITDSTGRFKIEVWKAEGVLALGIGPGSFLHDASGREAKVHFARGIVGDRGVLLAPDEEVVVPAAATACDAALAGSASAAPAGVGLLLLFKRPDEFESFNPTKSKRQQARDEAEAPWETDIEVQKLVATNRSFPAGTLVCILERKTRVGEYTGLRPSWAAPVVAYETTWEVRLLSSTPAKAQRTTLSERPPQSAAAITQGLAKMEMLRRPDQHLQLVPELLGRWLVKKSGN